MSYPITWKPAHPDNFTVGRGGTVPAWLVHHRMVGYLTGTDRHFAKADVRVSTHFGIGHRTAGGPVAISQYVALDDTAFGNGNNVDAGGNEVPSEWNRRGYPSQPNRHSISIEHEDGATARRGVVTDDIIEASIWLDRLLLSGDPAKLRAAGVRFRSETLVRSIGRIVPVDARHIIDHHFIAGPLKPYCWQPWLDDDGFPQARYLAALKEDPVQSFTILPDATTGSLVVPGPDHYYLRLRDGKLEGPLAPGWSKPLAFGPVRLLTPIPGGSGDRATGYIVGDEAAFLLSVDVDFTPAAAPALRPDLLLGPGDQFTIGVKA